MGHKVAEAIIEDGKITYVDKELPHGKLTVHIIYDMEDVKTVIDHAESVRETAGIYKDIEGDGESKKLRNEWERNVGR